MSSLHLVQRNLQFFPPGEYYMLSRDSIKNIGVILMDVDDVVMLIVGTHHGNRQGVYLQQHIPDPG